MWASSDRQLSFRVCTSISSWERRRRRCVNGKLASRAIAIPQRQLAAHDDKRAVLRRFRRDLKAERARHQRKGSEPLYFGLTRMHTISNHPSTRAHGVGTGIPLGFLLAGGRDSSAEPGPEMSGITAQTTVCGFFGGKELLIRRAQARTAVSARIERLFVVTRSPREILREALRDGQILITSREAQNRGRRRDRPLCLF